MFYPKLALIFIFGAINFDIWFQEHIFYNVIKGDLSEKLSLGVSVLYSSINYTPFSHYFRYGAQSLKNNQPAPASPGQTENFLILYIILRAADKPERIGGTVRQKLGPKDEKVIQTRPAAYYCRGAFI